MDECDIFDEEFEGAITDPVIRFRYKNYKNEFKNYIGQAKALNFGIPFKKSEHIQKPLVEVYLGENKRREFVLEKMDFTKNLWIKCEDEMPESGKNVLVFSPADHGACAIVIATYVPEGWYEVHVLGDTGLDYNMSPINCAITHWQHLPEKPNIE